MHTAIFGDHADMGVTHSVVAGDGIDWWRYDQFDIRADSTPYCSGRWRAVVSPIREKGGVGIRTKGMVYVALTWQRTRQYFRGA